MLGQWGTGGGREDPEGHRTRTEQLEPVTLGPFHSQIFPVATNKQTPPDLDGARARRGHSEAAEPRQWRGRVSTATPGTFCLMGLDRPLRVCVWQGWGGGQHAGSHTKMVAWAHSAGCGVPSSAGQVVPPACFLSPSALVPGSLIWENQGWSLAPGWGLTCPPPKSSGTAPIDSCFLLFLLLLSLTLSFQNLFLFI